MKLLAGLMLIVGLLIGAGAIQEINAYRPGELQFWVGILAAPIGFFFSGAGVTLLIRGHGARGMVFAAALLMFLATLFGTLTPVMGRLASLVGILSALAVLVWLWKTRRHQVGIA